MPIKVICPNGCVVRVPSNRAGKIVRCPTCKTVIRVDRNQFSGEARVDAAGKVEAQLNKLEQQLAETDTRNGSSKGIQIPDFDSNERAIEETPQSGLLIPKPISIRKRQNSPDKPQPIIFGKDKEEPREESVDEKTTLKKRANSARSDRITLARFFATCLCLAGLINLGPAIYYWVQWSQAIETSMLPRWIYLQVFIATIHFVYAVFIVQILDWAALRAVGYAMLGIAVIFGVLSTGLIMGGDQGTVATFLELPFSIVNKATMWCAAMLILSTLLCLWLGRESANWQRIEQLLDQILTSKTTGT